MGTTTLVSEGQATQAIWSVPFLVAVQTRGRARTEDSVFVVSWQIWAQGARAGDPLFFSSLYSKTCTRTRSAETADATYGRLPRSREPGGSAAGAGIGARQPLWVTHTHQAGRRRWQGAWRVETRWRGAARGDNRAIVASPGSARMPSPTSPCNGPRFLLLPSPSGRRWRRGRHRTCVHRRA